MESIKELSKKRSTEEKIKPLIDLYTKEEIPPSIRAFCRKYGVSRATFTSHLKNQISYRHGPSPILADLEEDALIALLRVFAARGLPISPPQLTAFASKILKKKLENSVEQLNSQLGRGWYERFRGRHPEIVLKKTSKLDPKRMEVSTLSIRNYFKSVRY